MAKVASKNANAFTKASSELARKRLNEQNELLQHHLSSQKAKTYFPEYRDDPVAYCNKVLGSTLWWKQRQILKALVKHRRVLVRSSHLTGKSFVCANAGLWAWDTHRPLSGVITATTAAQVKDVVFSEMRKLARPHHIFRGSAAPVLQDTEDHVVRGIVTADPTSMHGRHSPNVFLLIDEATGVGIETWEAMESLYAANAYWLAVFNPTDSSSYVHQLESTGEWHLITISALEHPNVQYAMKHPGDEKVLIPGCITLPRFLSMLRQWSTQIEAKDAKLLDIKIINEQGEEEWYRPGPIAESRLLGRWPSQSFDSVWSDTLIDQIQNLVIPPDYDNLPIEIGIDVARFGSDNSAFVARCGPTAIYAEEINGLSVTEVANFAMLKCRELSALNNVDERDIPIKVDLNGIGAGVVDILYDNLYNVIDIDVNRKALDPDKYHTIRSELWFNGVELAMNNKMTLYKLDNYMKHKLRGELLAPHYSVNASGQLVVEPKDKTKKRTNQPSPNIADALNLVFYDEVGQSITVTVVKKD